jgi:hypothetical protein
MGTTAEKALARENATQEAAPRSEQGKRGAGAPRLGASLVNVAIRARELALPQRIQSIRINNNMGDPMVKIKVPLPPDDPSGGEAEWMWADDDGESRFILRNVPVFAFGLSYGDTVKATNVEARLRSPVLLGEGATAPTESTLRRIAAHQP